MPELAEWLAALALRLPEPLVRHLPELALAGALAWGAGLRLYLVVFLFGLLGRMGWWPLPEHLSVLAHPLVLGASGFMAAVELFADKLPWLDSLWDGLHTFVRIPAGAALAAAAFGDSGAAVALAAGLLGGTLTATTHFAKSGARAAVNTSPEPFSNVAVSLGEDALVLGGVWLAVEYPLLFLAALVLFLVAAVLLIRLILRGLRRLFGARPA
ncbi:MAG TPA: DUF4126 domain-containing protein [Burkholderiaceae bacterium]|mgnify:FL=1|jgi:hypothetical protein|nr:DUF4126 domain-containing protein [Burkholderiaceae bacterium]